VDVFQSGLEETNIGPERGNESSCTLEVCEFPVGWLSRLPVTIHS